jgi:hypothetical protein
LVSQKAIRVYLGCFAVVFTSAIALRVEAAIYARRIVSVLTALSTLRLGETSKAETLQRIPALQPSQTRGYGAPHCDADECLSGFVANGLPGRLLSSTRSDFLSDVLRWWGFRSEFLDVNVKFKSEKFSGFDYSLWVSAPGVLKSVPPPPKDGEMGMVVIGVSSQMAITGGETKGTVETRPPYRIIPARSAPSQSISIFLTPDAPDEIQRGTFDLRLTCIWNFGGCRRWSELVPSIEPLARK